MPVVGIPAQLRGLTGGVDRVTVPGRTVGEIIAELDRMFPGISDRLCDASRLRPGLAVAIDDRFATAGLLEPVGEASEVHFLPAISGGEGA
jgi:molybdopterin converting factor small subunit